MPPRGRCWFLEKLKQPQKAVDVYSQMLAREKEFVHQAPLPAISSMLAMARGRKDHPDWLTRAEWIHQQLTRSPRASRDSSQ